MENKKLKCSSIDHDKVDAIVFCNKCEIYMCNKCENFHSKLFRNHNIINLDKEIKEVFTGICSKGSHLDKLDYYCKTHNKLCCAACLSKIKSKGNGQHSECDVCNIRGYKR